MDFIVGMPKMLIMVVACIFPLMDHFVSCNKTLDDLCKTR